MAKAGDYWARFEWLRRLLGTPDAFGQKPGALKSRERSATFPSQGFLWGALEEVAADRTTEKESERQETTATVRLRGYPDVAPGDQLYHVAFDTTWTVRTAVWGDNETTCEVWS